MIRLLATLLGAAILLAAAAAPAATPKACGGPVPKVRAGGTAANLAISIVDRARLREAVLRCAGGTTRITGPLRGTVYYARYRGYDWAIATFSIGPAQTTDQPERFVRRTGARPWRDLGDTGGPLADYGIPCPVLRVWRMACR